MFAYLSGLAVRRYNVSFSEKEASAYLKKLLFTELYFEVNPVLLCIHVLKLYIDQQVTDSNFFLLFVGISEGDLKIKLGEAQAKINACAFPTTEQIKVSMEKFDKIKNVAAQLKRVKLKKPDFHQPEPMSLKRVKKEVTN